MDWGDLKKQIPTILLGFILFSALQLLAEGDILSILFISIAFFLLYLFLDWIVPKINKKLSFIYKLKDLQEENKKMKEEITILQNENNKLKNKINSSRPDSVVKTEPESEWVSPITIHFEKMFENFQDLPYKMLGWQKRKKIKKKEE
ncbi:MAG: hypothetical protein ABH986_06950 [archaeon]